MYLMLMPKVNGSMMCLHFFFIKRKIRKMPLPWGYMEDRKRIRIRPVISPSISLVLIHPPPYKIERRWTLNFSFFGLKTKDPSSGILSKMDLIKKVKARIVLGSILASGSIQDYIRGPIDLHLGSCSRFSCKNLCIFF